MATPKLKIMSRLLLVIVIITILALTCQGRNILLSGQRLAAGQSLDEGFYSLKMQDSCNLVLYDRGAAIWTSNKGFRHRKCDVTMQTDGNLVIYDAQYNVVWASNSWQGYRVRRYALVVQEDGDVVIYGSHIWSTGTHRSGVSGVVRTVMNGTVDGGFIRSENASTMIVGEISQNDTTVGKVVAVAAPA